jgi:hypothetical protein
MVSDREATLRITIDPEALQQAITEAFRPIREAIQTMQENLLGMGTALDEVRGAIEKWEVAVGDESDQ